MKKTRLFLSSWSCPLSRTSLGVLLLCTLTWTGSADEVFLQKSNFDNLNELQLDSRELQVDFQEKCRTDVGNAVGTTNNFILSAEIFDFSQNKLVMEVIEVARVTSGIIRNYPSHLMLNSVGTITPGSIETWLNEVPVEQTGASSCLGIDNRTGTFRGSIEDVYEGVGDVIFRYKFQVEDLVCLVGNGSQAIPFGFYGLINERTYSSTEIDLFVSADLADTQVDFDITPLPSRRSCSVINNRSACYHQYGSSRDIGIYRDGGGDSVNAFIILNGSYFDESVVTKPCALITERAEEEEEDTPGLQSFFIVVIAIPGAICGILVLVSIVLKFQHDRSRRLRRERRRNDPRVYPGSPDIIIAPPQDQEMTVQAIHERDVETDLDQVMPVTTINVNLDEARR